jgi:hypothetical protein
LIGHRAGTALDQQSKDGLPMLVDRRAQRFDDFKFFMASTRFRGIIAMSTVVKLETEM